VGPIGGAVAAVVLSPVISRTALGLRVSPVLQRLARPRTGAFGTVNVVLIGLLLVIGLGVAYARVNPATALLEKERGLPVQAVEWMDATGLSGNMFNRYEWGGYIGEHRPTQKVFMDGRADVYGDELLRQYVRLIGVEGDPQEVLDRYAIDYAVMPPEWELAAWFDASPDWERAYADATAAIWVRR